MAILAAAALASGAVGFGRLAAAAGEPRSAWDLLYLALQLFILESGAVPGPVPWELEVARFAAPAVAAYTAVRAVALLFGEELERLRVRLRRNHVVVCGLGRKGLLLATTLRDRGERVTVVEEDAENEWIGAARSRRIPVLVGDARAAELLRAARAGRARHLVAVTGDDGINAEIVVRARSLAERRRRGSLSCLAHVVDPRLCHLLRMQEIGRPAVDGFRLDFFNVYESGARALLTEHPALPGPHGGEGGGAHLLVVGLGQLGTGVVLEAARASRERGAEAAGELTVTVVDREARRLAGCLEVDHPWLGAAARIEPEEMTVESREFVEARFVYDSAGRPRISAAYVCIDDESVGLTAGLVLHRHLRPHGLPVVVRMAHASGLASLLDEPGGGLAGLHAFPLLDRTCKPELLFAGVYEILARVIHQEYLRDQRRRGATPETHAALVPWEDLPEHFKESNRAQAQHVGVKLAAVGCDLAPLGAADSAGTAPVVLTPDEIERLAEMEHERWVQERKRDGWTLGAKDPDRKRSPFLVPWGELADVVRDDDRAFVRNLPGILARAGYEIVRLDGG